MKTTEFTPTLDMSDATKAVFMAKAWTETVRPIVEGYQREILARHNWHSDKRWTGKGLNSDRIITDHRHIYLLEDKDFETYHQESIEARKKAGLEVINDDFCPLLVAENMERMAVRAMLKTMTPFTKLDPDDVWDIEDYHKLTELTLSLLAPFVKI